MSTFSTPPTTTTVVANGKEAKTTHKWRSIADTNILTNAAKEILLKAIESESSRGRKITSKIGDSEAYKTAAARRSVSEEQLIEVKAHCLNNGMRKRHADDGPYLLIKLAGIFDNLNVKKRIEGAFLPIASVEETAKNERETLLARNNAAKKQKVEEKLQTTSKANFLRLKERYKIVASKYDTMLEGASGKSLPEQSRESLVEIEEITRLINETVSDFDGSDDRAVFMRKVNAKKNEIMMLTPTFSSSSEQDLDLKDLSEAFDSEKSGEQDMDTDDVVNDKEKRATVSRYITSGDGVKDAIARNGYLRRYSQSTLPNIKQRLSDILDRYTWTGVRNLPCMSYFYVHSDGSERHDQCPFWSNNDNFLLVGARDECELPPRPNHLSTLAIIKQAKRLIASASSALRFREQIAIISSPLSTITTTEKTTTLTTTTTIAVDGSKTTVMTTTSKQLTVVGPTTVPVRKTGLVRRANTGGTRLLPSEIAQVIIRRELE